MHPWTPISEFDFRRLFQTQYRELAPAVRVRLDPYLVPFWRANIQRSEEAGFETVFVVAQKGTGVLYFDDVEDGFNVSETDEQGRILQPGGSQATLAEAIELWLPEI